jgi:DNA primase
MELLFDPVGCSYDGKEVPDTKYWVPRILFPVYSPRGELYGFSGRATIDTRLKVRDYHGLKKSQVLLGVHQVGISSHVILVEGLFAHAHLRTLGFPSVASLGANLAEGQASILKDLGKAVYIMYDPDKAGQKAVDQVKRTLSKYVPVLGTYYPEGYTDIDDLPKDAIINMLAEAEIL